MARPSTYTIKQTADLYRVSIDTLRYYEEIGLVVPARNPANGYRAYQWQDFSRLNVIMSLLDMDFTLAQIKELFGDHCLAKSLDLIEVEVDQLTERIDQLTRKRSKVESCLLELAKSIHAAPSERIVLSHHPARPYLSIGPLDGNPQDIPLAVAKKARDLGFPIDAFHSIPCFSLDTATMSDQGEFTSSEILMYSAAPSFESDRCFPEGDYLSVTFSGGAGKTPKMYRLLCEAMAARSLAPQGNPVEFWHVHEYISDNPAEYIQTLEQRVA